MFHTDFWDGVDHPILFFDSGIGGLPYFKRFRERNAAACADGDIGGSVGGCAGYASGSSAMYIADREHFPYGHKTRKEIADILIRLAAELLKHVEPQAAVLACNTASVSALDALREMFPSIPWVGTVPAIKPAALASKTRCVGVIGTDRTIEDPYIMELARKYSPDAKIVGLAASDIVRFVEEGGERAPEAEKERMVFPYIEQLRAAGADTLALGCTHFLLLLDTFRRLAMPDIVVFDSVEGVVHRIEEVLESTPDRGHRAAGAVLLLTGSAPIEPLWRERARAFGLDIRRLDSRRVPEKAFE
ncbi:MAG: aspartate/glutamate racemase family protein [Treponema sp.]|jgi:glutamate racemase|nr:aspartate/glutamate racemase family protein [Treponema sp.]